MRGITNTVTAVHDLIDAVREKNAGIPDNITVVISSGRTGKTMKHGHFAASAWSDDSHEILLGAESLSRGAVETAGTVIHELAHAYAAHNGIKDTSNAGRYHSGKFREIGERFGLTLEKHDVIGWSITTVPEETQRLYRKEIDALEESITVWRKDPTALGLKEKEKSNQLKRKMQCDSCQEPLLVTKKWFEAVGHTLYCTEHDMYYEMYEEGGENG